MSKSMLRALLASNGLSMEEAGVDSSEFITPDAAAAEVEVAAAPEDEVATELEEIGDEQEVIAGEVEDVAKLDEVTESLEALLSNITASMESAPLTARELGYINDNVATLFRGIGVKVTPMLSQEALANPAAAATLTLEGIVDTIKKLYTSISAGLGRIRERIKAWGERVFTFYGRIKARAQKLRKAVEAQEGEKSGSVYSKKYSLTALAESDTSAELVDVAKTLPKLNSAVDHLLGDYMKDLTSWVRSGMSGKAPSLAKFKSSLNGLPCSPSVGRVHDKYDVFETKDFKGKVGKGGIEVKFNTKADLLRILDEVVALAEGFKKNFDVIWSAYETIQTAVDKLAKARGIPNEKGVDRAKKLSPPGSSFEQLQKDAAQMRATAFTAFQVPTDVYWYAVNIAYASLTYVAVQLGAKSAA